MMYSQLQAPGKRRKRGAGLLLLIFILLVLGGLSIEMTQRFAGARHAQRRAEVARAEHLLKANGELLAASADAQGLMELQHSDGLTTISLRRVSGNWQIKAVGLHPLAHVEGEIAPTILAEEQGEGK